MVQSQPQDGISEETNEKWFPDFTEHKSEGVYEVCSGK
jgi:hypothetical protein